jgi:hypothetical protein
MRDPISNRSVTRSRSPLSRSVICVLLLLHSSFLPLDTPEQSSLSLLLLLVGSTTTGLLTINMTGDDEKEGAALADQSSSKIAKDTHGGVSGIKTASNDNGDARVRGGLSAINNDSGSNESNQSGLQSANDASREQGSKRGTRRGAATDERGSDDATGSDSDAKTGANGSTDSNRDNQYEDVSSADKHNEEGDDDSDTESDGIGENADDMDNSEHSHSLNNPPQQSQQHERQQQQAKDSQQPANNCSTRSSSRSIRKRQRQAKQQTRYRSNWLPTYYCFLIHIACCLVYMLPILTPSEYNTGTAVLDEMHILVPAQQDVYGTSDLRTIFSNDYWGRSMQAHNSHKSWRPLSILSFRYLTGGRQIQEWIKQWWKSNVEQMNGAAIPLNLVTLPRLVNVFTHACAAELVGILAVRLVPGQIQEYRHSHRLLLLRTWTKLLWALHPTHVEVTANAANRPHLLAILCSLLLCDARINMLVYWVVLVAGFLCAETFLFQVIPITVTLFAVAYQQQQRHHCSEQSQDVKSDQQPASSESDTSNGNNAGTAASSEQPSSVTTSEAASYQLIPSDSNGESKVDGGGSGNSSATHNSANNDTSLWSSIASALNAVKFRIASVWLATIVYYGARYAADTLSIPSELIRPAENPFVQFTGLHRVRNYAYVLAIHVAKAWDVDVIGFSHEYGFDCIPALTSWSDKRLWLVFLVVAVYAGALGLLAWLHKRRGASAMSTGAVLFLVHLSWMTTLFPIAGIIKVGTFVADRIGVASTVSVSILLGHWISTWLTSFPDLQVAHADDSPRQQRRHGHDTGGNLDPTQRRQLQWLVLCIVVGFQWRRIHNRTIDWLDPYTLLQSSLRTCPRFAKPHLELSKVYSGLYPSKFNLTTSRWHLEQVEEIDPDFCDVHQQFAHVSIQEHKYDEFEDRLTKACLCPFTLASSMDLFRRYWSMTTDPQQNPPLMAQAALARYNEQMRIINKAVEEREGPAK